MAQFATISFPPSKVYAGTEEQSASGRRRLYITAISAQNSATITLGDTDNIVMAAGTSLSLSNPIRVTSFQSSDAAVSIVYYEA